MFFPFPLLAEGELNVTVADESDVLTSVLLSSWDGTGKAIIFVTGDVSATQNPSDPFGARQALRFDKPGTYDLIVSSGVTITGNGTGGSALYVDSGSTVTIVNEGTITGGGGAGRWITNFGTVTFSGSGDFIGGSFGV